MEKVVVWVVEVTTQPIDPVTGRPGVSRRIDHQKGWFPSLQACQEACNEGKGEKPFPICPAE